ncbi:MAG: thiamine diphosphokinase [Ardenticatenaceae bacterium]|nr:thiamine diphosphokinase [Ardenticatenaceae bacterium]HBY94357.1 thiamine diphosphokinase [Chloroflexota bacterium]
MRVVIFGNGNLWDIDYERSLIRPDDRIYCADGGSRHAFELGIVPDLVIGDSDSLAEAPRAWLLSHNVSFQSHPTEKDATDFELALQAAIAAGADSVLMLGATGTRTDHTFANFSLLAAARRAGVAAQIVAGRQHCFFISNERIMIHGESGQTLSLLPWGDDARGVTAEGVYWPLRDATLVFGETRGISNVLVADEAQISVRQGVLLVVHHRGPVE